MLAEASPKNRSRTPNQYDDTSRAISVFSDVCYKVTLHRWRSSRPHYDLWRQKSIFLSFIFFLSFFFLSFFLSFLRYQVSAPRYHCLFCVSSYNSICGLCWLFLVSFKRFLATSQCANHFDHLGFLPKIATNHTVNLAKSHTDTWLRKTEK